MVRSVDKIIDNLGADRDGLTGLEFNILMEYIKENKCPDVLLRALKNGDGKYIVSVAWVASEIGDLACALEDELAVLTRHRCAQVRYYSIEAISNFCEKASRGTLSIFIKNLDDESQFVCAKCALFIAYAPKFVVERALDLYKRCDLSISRNLVTAYSASENLAELKEILKSNSRIESLFTLGCIFRNFEIENLKNLIEFVERDEFFWEIFNFMHDYACIIERGRD